MNEAFGFTMCQIQPIQNISGVRSSGIWSLGMDYHGVVDLDDECLLNGRPVTQCDCSRLVVQVLKSA